MHPPRVPGPEALRQPLVVSVHHSSLDQCRMTKFLVFSRLGDSRVRSLLGSLRVCRVMRQPDARQMIDNRHEEIPSS